MFLKFVAIVVQILLWLRIVLSPVAIAALIATGICIGIEEINYYVIFPLLIVGLIIGVIWAENTRNSIGLSNFWGRLIRQSRYDDYHR